MRVLVAIIIAQATVIVMFALVNEEHRRKADQYYQIAVAQNKAIERYSAALRDDAVTIKTSNDTMERAIVQLKADTVTIQQCNVMVTKQLLEAMSR